MFPKGLFGVNSVTGTETSGWVGDSAVPTSPWAERWEVGMPEKVVVETES